MLLMARKKRFWRNDYWWVVIWFGVLMFLIGLGTMFYPSVPILTQSSSVIALVKPALQENHDTGTVELPREPGVIAKRLFKGQVLFPKDFKERMLLYRNSSLVDPGSEWAVCLYGYSYDLSQDFKGFFVENVTFGYAYNRNATSVYFGCDVVNTGSGRELIGDAHLHFNQVPGNFSPSFEDTISWAGTLEQSAKFDLHCIFNNIIDFACWNSGVQPIIIAR